jgi:hypothetical protein
MRLKIINNLYNNKFVVLSQINNKHTTQINPVTNIEA